MISSLNSIANDWWNLIISISLQLAILFPVILFSTLLFKKQSARFLHVLWMIPLFKVFIPPNIDIPFWDNINQLPLIDLSYVPVFNPSIIIESTNSTLTLQSILFLIWSILITILLLRAVVTNVSCRLLLKSSRHIEKELMLSIKEKLDLKHSPRIYSSDRVQSPMTIALFRPSIYLPSECKQWKQNTLQAFLLHEIAHIKRKDLWIKTLQMIAQSIYFFHPVIWITNHYLYLYRERACDDFVIRKFGNDSISYSRILFEFINERIRYPKQIPMMEFFFKSKKSLETRFDYLVNYQKERILKTKILYKFIILLIMLAAFSLSFIEIGIANTKFPSSLDLKFTKQDIINYSSKRERDYSLIESSFNHSEKRKSETKQIIEPLTQKNPISTKKKPQSKIDQEFDRTIKLTQDSNPRLAKREYEIIKYTKSLNIIHPEPIGGYSAILNKLEYPRIAKQAGIEGMVVVQALIGTKGQVKAVKVLKSLGNNGCDQAAIAAVKKVQWRPASQNGIFRQVWVTIPFHFNRKSIKSNEKYVNNKPIKKQQKSQKTRIIPPKPVGGYATIMNQIRQNKKFHKIKQNGLSVIDVLIDDNGRVRNTKIVKSSGPIYDQIATQAVTSIKWLPAKKQSKNISIWVKVPINFRI